MKIKFLKNIIKKKYTHPFIYFITANKIYKSK